MNDNKNRERINVTFDIDSYNQIKQIASKENKSMSEVVREWSMQGLNGTLTKDNLDFIVPIIREQLNSILTPSIERLASLSAKTCIQAGVSAYLTAETISKLVPVELQEEVEVTYYAARKKAVKYMRGKTDLD